MYAHALLLGGAGDGTKIQLSRCHEQITAYIYKGAYIGLAPGEQVPSGARELGRYQLVGPPGPEEPVYVSSY